MTAGNPSINVKMVTSTTHRGPVLPCGISRKAFRLESGRSRFDYPLRLAFLFKNCRFWTLCLIVTLPLMIDTVTATTSLEKEQ